MEEIIQYLELKNHYYHKFLSISNKFLSKALKNQWDDITFFVDNRERILNIIRTFDFKIAELFEKSDMDKTSINKYRQRVKSLLDEREKVARQIVNTDLELIAKIDEMKSETIRDLKRTLETHQQLDSFTGSSQSSITSKATKTV